MLNDIDWKTLREAAEKNAEKKEPNKEIFQDVVIESPIGPIVVETPKAKNRYEQRSHFLKYIGAFQGNVLAVGFLIKEYEELSQRIKEDIIELQKCYKAGAYKATLIMAGSILEAFLLDWLSERDGKDYFTEPFKVQVIDADGKTKWEKRESLSEYIEQIKELEKPEWMESSKKAHYIRTQRNSVHAKVCLKKEVGIDKETCEKVIDYLTDIIETRLKKQHDMLSDLQK